MSYRSLLSHSCNIYKRETSTSQGSYGVPGEEVTTYPENPTYSDVPCYFGSKGINYYDVAPGVEIEETWLVHFLPNVDISYADRVEWEGVMYEARKPRNIRNHHLEVIVVKADG